MFISRWSPQTQIDMNDQNVIFYYDIINNGPSHLQELSGEILIPFSIKIDDDVVILVDIEKLNISQTYKSKSIDFTSFNVESFVEPKLFNKTKKAEHVGNSTDTSLNNKHNLQSNMTVYLNCSSPNISCMQIKFKIHNFTAKQDEPIKIIVEILFDLDEIGKIQSFHKIVG